jgi:hypothetical protein
VDVIIVGNFLLDKCNLFFSLDEFESDINENDDNKKFFFEYDDLFEFGNI